MRWWTGKPRWVLAGGLALAAAVPAPATMAPRSAAADEPAPGANRQFISIRWSNGQFTGHDRDSFVAPGIGEGEVVCSRYTQWVSFQPADLAKRANMWVIRKRGDITAVKANRLDHPRTGREYNEGMNEFGNDLEDSGSFVGIISLRPGAEEAGGPRPTPTTFRVNWNWKFGAEGDRCEVTGVVVSPPVTGSTEVLGALTVNWQHDSPGGRDGDGMNVPGVGTLRITCNHEGQWLTLHAEGDDRSVAASTYEGEGTQAVTHQDRGPVDGEPIAIRLPPNGMITATLRAGGQERGTLVLSSEYELNHDENRDLNKCFVAAQVVART